MSERVDIHLGKRLRWRRKAMGLTQQHVGEALGIRFQQVQKYECAANRMSAAVLWKLAKILDVDVRYFFDGLAEIAPPVAAGVGKALENERPGL
jgi:transcriptional regulator with XRE-family HTH domain